MKDEDVDGKSLSFQAQLPHPLLYVFFTYIHSVLLIFLSQLEAKNSYFMYTRLVSLTTTIMTMDDDDVMGDDGGKM
jgi:hypothetical protein